MEKIQDARLLLIHVNQKFYLCLDSVIQALVVIPACLESFRLVRNREERSWTSQDDRDLAERPMRQ